MNTKELYMDKMDMEKNYIATLRCSESTKKLIMEDCIREFLKFNPKFNGFNISQGFILRRIAEHYLNSEPL